MDATDRHYLLRYPVAVAYCDWSLVIGRTRGRAITNDWRRTMTRSVVCNCSNSGDDHRPILRSIIASDDRSYHQSACRVTDRTINRGILRPIIRSVMGYCDRSHDQSWHPATDRMSNHGISDRSYYWSHHQLHTRATTFDTSRVVALPNVM